MGDWLILRMESRIVILKSFCRSLKHWQQNWAWHQRSKLWRPWSKSSLKVAKLRLRLQMCAQIMQLTTGQRWVTTSSNSPKHYCRSRKCRAKYLFRFRNSCCSADSFVHGAKSTVTVCIWCWTDRDISGADGTEVALLLHIQCMHVSAHVTADFSELFRGCL